ncbi:alkali metal cation/H+ antiporter Nha1 C terminus-domain-containing protein [Aspergillus leporis]|jgi:Na(+)/H(+) antiporter|uniref:Alkali metal cation/H+ antiporter Nha1 C terminus-domain-containing protein n=1 Tax=Aspergillus leporis TaxID=41062 RepID=A0A5N5WP80_9EURO|nr:alkali metal cation/H+ antiporter Nha1 C terminus-domain-containing protein [Aspergillus leporis]
MAWDHLDIDKPHLAYMILGGFTGLFMLCSLFVKEKLYIGEATVATICGIIFGPHAANLFNPHEWGNIDKITLECSRIVLVVQCFAVGVELPKSYMNRHWKSVSLLLVPVMTWGWLITSLFIWWMVPPLSWLESLVCAACVTATDPVLASSVVGKGKFAKRVPKHLRDLLSAESGCNDGMAFPFIYLSFYILRYRPDAGKVSLHWFCVTILYECIFGAFYGFIIGYAARHAIKWAERKQLIDRESFLVFYFVLAVFCAGSGSLLGLDDLLVGFSAGVGFSNDGWFTEKTEESHVSNVIDLLLNLAYFVYFGSIIPWESYNAPELGLVPWRLVVIAILVIFFRRIPIMLLLKPIIPDVKTWREALFAGHFGPIGVGAIFAAILARAELETDSTQPLAESELPKAGSHDYYIVQLIWPITTFMVISSILVHGSSIAVFTLGKRINTLTITLSYTTANEEGPSWMNRLPRVQSFAKGSMSFRKADDMDESSNEQEYPPGTLPPIGVPGNFLRRVRDEDTESPTGRTSSRRPRRRHRHASGAGGPISQSAIAPQRTTETEDAEEREERDRIDREGSTPSKEGDRFGREPIMEVYLEGHHMVIEDEEGNVLKTEDVSHISPEERQQHIEQQRDKLVQEHSGEFAKSRRQPHARNEGEEVEDAIEGKTGHSLDKARKRFGQWIGLGKGRTQEADEQEAEKAAEKKKGQAAAGKKTKGKSRSAHAYQFGNTIIVEDEDGEVIKKYSIPATDKPEPGQAPVRRGLTRMGTWFGMDGEGEPSQAGQVKKPGEDDWLADDGLRFTVADDDSIGKKGVAYKGRRMNKHEFVQQLRNLGPKARRDLVEETDAPQHVKDVAQVEARDAERQEAQESSREDHDQDKQRQMTPARPASVCSSDSSVRSDVGVPGDNIAASLARFNRGTAAERRSTLSPSTHPRSRRDSEDDGTERVPPAQLREAAGLTRPPQQDDDDTGETPAERRRRLAALGELKSDDSDDSDAAVESDGEDSPGLGRVGSKVQFVDGTKSTESGNGSSSNQGNGSSSSSSRAHQRSISWGGEKGRET